MSHPDLRIDADRLWRRLMQLAEIGATRRGGVRRLALSDADGEARRWFIRRCQQAGCAITIDQLGNIFARRRGAQEELPPIMAGSHLDSQPSGGKFDGALGVLAALEVVETLNDHDAATTHPLEIVSWTNEEGARFVPAMLGSGTYAGVFELSYALSRRDKAGISVADALQHIGFAGEAPVTAKPIHAAFELHIEQGPLLEQAGRQIGIVTGVQGARWYEIRIPGREAHAGTTPMAARRDPLPLLGRLISSLYQLVEAFQPDARLTIGELSALPGAINTVPGAVRLSLDLRHPDAGRLADMDEELRELIEQLSHGEPTPIQLTDLWHSPPSSFSPACVNAVRQAAAQLALSAQPIISGAGHDAVYLNRVAPTGMIFIPCEKGLSHNEAENIARQDAAAGANVLLQAILQVDRQP